MKRRLSKNFAKAAGRKNERFGSLVLLSHRLVLFD